MYVVQILLPLYDNDGRPFPRSAYIQVRDELVARFGGLTAYTRAPARGLWQEEGEDPVRDDIVIYEVMCEDRDEGWWREYRVSVERQFAQQRLIVRAHPIFLL